jgi:hypothetical protein
VANGSKIWDLTRTLTMKKFAFSSIIWVPAVQIEHARALLKGLSSGNVLTCELLATCACGLLYSSTYKIEHDYALSIRNFMVIIKKSEKLDFETLPFLASGHKLAINLKIPICICIRIGNFVLVMNNWPKHGIEKNTQNSILNFRPISDPKSLAHESPHTDLQLHTTISTYISLTHCLFFSHRMFSR